MTLPVVSPVVCVMGPTASGKTGIAVALAERFDVSIISVDSAQVYRGMNIGTAKPDENVQAVAPHKLIDIRDPEDGYSAGDFVVDATREIAAAYALGRIPVLVGGTMLYFRALIDGIATLPKANEQLRAVLDAQAADLGWPNLHRRLSKVDPTAAARIKPSDGQRIQRALEVFEISGIPLSQWHAEADNNSVNIEFLKFALMPADRSRLHARIQSRLDSMLELGFLKEVEGLMRRPGLTARHASMRAVGYRQFWEYFENQFDLETATFRALVATRQLAKRQLTWLRADKQLIALDPLEVRAADAISASIEGLLAKRR